MEDFIMRLSAPKNVVFIISVILLVVGVIGWFVAKDNVGGLFNGPWVTFAGGALLSLGCLLKGL
jgi:hypothetical protein